jgi:3-hydroxybutyryl-CoA dehydrogenase
MRRDRRADALKGQVPLGFLVLKAGRHRATCRDREREVVRWCATASARSRPSRRAVVQRLPKTRSGKILRGTMQKIADKRAWKMPATIDDPARDRVCGMHYFNPVPLMKLVEVIRAADTAQWVVDAMVALGKRQTRVPVVVGDTPGFLVNLGGTAIGTEGLRIMQEGRATPSQVDAVMRDTCGFRMGPFELMDLTGIDVNFPARKIIYEGFFHDRRMTPSPYHESLYAAGKLGRKTGGGWYGYDEKGGKIDAGADHPTSHVPASSVVIMDTPQHQADEPGECGRCEDAGGRRRQEPDPRRADRQGLHHDGDRTRPRPEAHRRGRPDRRRLQAHHDHDGAGLRSGDPRRTVALLAKSGTKVTVIKDSPGFIAQRMCSMIANLGCEMAMIGIASARRSRHGDDARPQLSARAAGPGGLLGVKECHEILVQIQAITGDDRYRPSQWLRRRAYAGPQRHDGRVGNIVAESSFIPCSLCRGTR